MLSKTGQTGQNTIFLGHPVVSYHVNKILYKVFVTAIMSPGICSTFDIFDIFINLNMEIMILASVQNMF